jgi:hypothetical protein
MFEFRLGPRLALFYLLLQRTTHNESAIGLLHGGSCTSALDIRSLMLCILRRKPF